MIIKACYVAKGFPEKHLYFDTEECVFSQNAYRNDVSIRVYKAFDISILTARLITLGFVGVDKIIKRVDEE